MKRIFSILFALVLVLSFSLVAAVPVSAATTYTVDDDWQIGAPPYAEDTDGDNDFATIQAAINAASSGDTVQVAAGTYFENITLVSGVIVQGAGAVVTTIDGGGSGSVVTGADNSTITGFTITGGYAGIYFEESPMTVTGNIVTGNSNGIYFLWSPSPAMITNNVITNNEYNGIKSQQSSATIADNVITGNGRGILCAWGPSSPTITNNIITSNYLYGIRTDYSSPNITNAGFPISNWGHRQALMVE